jgi:hypothetical protein
MANNSNVMVVMGASVVLTMGVGFFLAMSTGGSDSAPPQPVRSQVAVQAIDASPPAAVPDPPVAAVPEPPVAAVPRDAARPGSNRGNHLARDVKREQIWSALDRKHALQPAAPGSAAPTQVAAKRLPELDREYIRSAISEQLLPVAVECYESALADDPELAGKLVAEFTIVGAEEVGGIVEEATINAGESTLDNEFVRECLRESLMAVTFEPPPDGGQVQVTYPFEFRP